jgi:hypothetical protein
MSIARLDAGRLKTHSYRIDRGPAIVLSFSAANPKGFAVNSPARANPKGFAINSPA